MGKFDDEVAKLHKEMTGKLGIKRVDSKLLGAVAKSLGPSLYKEDSKRVSCSDTKELETVKKKFCIKKLGMKDTPKLDDKIKEVCKDMGARNRNKYRAIFYYLLTKKLKKSGVFK